MTKTNQIKRYKTLSALDLSAYPALVHVIEHQLAVWPDHEPAIATSLGNHSTEILDEVEQQASIVTQIAETHFNGLETVCKGYRYFCETMILESELFSAGTDVISAPNSKKLFATFTAGPI